MQYYKHDMRIKQELNAENPKTMKGTLHVGQGFRCKELEGLYIRYLCDCAYLRAVFS